jgi:hypothetical protein
VRAGRRIAALTAAALAACTSTSAPQPGALFNEPTAVAVFRGVTIASGADPADPVYPYRPYMAVANSGANALSIIDALTDAIVPAPIPLRGLVYPVPGRPMILVSADLGDLKPDLLVAVAAGELPTLGGSRLVVLRTWAADGAIAGQVDLPGDVLALAALPFDPAAPGQVKLAAALADERVAVVTFARSTAGDGTAIDVAAAQASVAASAPLGFQPLDVAALPDDRTRVFVASGQPIFPTAVLGIAEIDVTGTPALARALDARAPTRLVAAMRLAEALPLSTAMDPSAFAGQPRVTRVYAVLDESGCGLAAPIACGLVALDPATGGLVPDPTPAGTMQAPFRAPIAIAGRPVALGATLPPAQPPDAADPVYSGTYMRIATALATRATTGAGALMGTDGGMTFVDLGRWEVPSTVSIHASVAANVSSNRPSGTTGDQWLVLALPGGQTVAHSDPAGLSTAVGRTAGFTPTDRWTVTLEGPLPQLQLRRAEAGNDGAPWLALQVTDGADVREVVRVHDPTLGIHPGDIALIEPTALGTCTSFEATIEAILPPDAARPGGALRLGHRVPANAAWDECLDLVTGPVGGILATIRAGGYVLTRGTSPALHHVGRPEIGKPFEVSWQPEDALAAACPLPPAVAWPASGRPEDVPACDATCRAACEALVRARLARRIGYLTEAPSDRVGPALAFTLALEQPAAATPRDLSLSITTFDGRTPFRVGPTAGVPVGPRAAVPFDRSPWSGVSGVRFLAPYVGGLVLDATPTISGGSVVTIR